MKPDEQSQGLRVKLKLLRKKERTSDEFPTPEGILALTLNVLSPCRKCGAKRINGHRLSEPISATSIVSRVPKPH